MEKVVVEIGRPEQVFKCPDCGAKLSVFQHIGRWFVKYIGGNH